MTSNNITRLFKWLIIVNIILYLSSLALPYFDDVWLNEKELDVLSYISYGEIVSLPTIVHWFILFAWFAAYIGMYYFIPLARLLFLTLICVSTILVVVSGIYVMTPLDAFLSDLGNIIDGAILSIVYLSSVAMGFKKREPAEPDSI